MAMNIYTHRVNRQIRPDGHIVRRKQSALHNRDQMKVIVRVREAVDAVTVKTPALR